MFDAGGGDLVPLEDFLVGRDGSWCLFANRHLLTCVLQAGRALRLNIEPEGTSPASRGSSGGGESGRSGAGGGSGVGGLLASPGDYDLSFHVELRSSMYRDVLRETAPVVLRVTPPVTPPATASSTNVASCIIS